MERSLGVSGWLFIAATGLLAITGALVNVQAVAEPTPSRPVVVELFQSQGCSSCPPANANLNLLADRADVIALSFGVTYWDKLGWKDTFASAENTSRQWDYARGSLQNSNVYTPQVVINGRKDIVGADLGELKQEIARASLPPGGPVLALSSSSLSIGAAAAPRGGADVWLVRYDPRTVQVAIQRGENGGRTLPHRNVVRELIRLGAWSGSALRFDLPAPTDPAFKTAILVQSPGGGQVLAALKS